MDNSEASNQRWWNEDTVAVVTGANKGIGFAIVRQLAEHGIRVILTARDEERGNTAANNLNQQGFHNVVFHQLNVKDDISVQGFANWMKDNYGKLDILVNNAGISGLAIDYDILNANKAKFTLLYTHPGSKVEGISETHESTKECIDINYYGTKRMVEAVLPLLKLAGEGGGRIVNVSSSAGVLEHIPNENIRQQLNNFHDLSEEKIDAILQSFLTDFQQGLLKIKGWPLTISGYFVSKAAVNAYTRILAQKHPHMYVNCVNPGFVSTDMNLNMGW
ncbi:hypothetical protein KI387_039356, partial [Taxus chinensis]